ncbi:hypothetical protein [Pseudoalteromonas luteoviolacea]|uniref:Uncharacterized protein n=1 Tax=Pseudoalteromonas luteoviolacea NCIMB 1942 TaxID=1365253 RepID=A0A167AXM1_9GAMM|nr:hypothetical protein [Pseudoalteromonas luteoviolacea]KZN45924.1 hypothetical protein N482_13565 [Pseudoalteromonas luteoviolacea NCIMB 1942]KZW99606.1 hypothetical protein JL49_16325 [Pseudoalteromonas luteoviolacea]
MHILKAIALYLFLICTLYNSPLIQAKQIVGFEEFLVTEGEWKKGVKPNVTQLSEDRVFFTWAESSYPNKVKGRLGYINSDKSVALGHVQSISDIYKLGGWNPPESVRLKDGRIAIIWNNTYEVYLRVATINLDDSWTLGPEQKIAIEQSSVPMSDATVLSDGRLLVTWTGYDEQIVGIFASIGVVQPNGVFIEQNQFQVNELSQSVQNAPRVTAIDNAKAIFTWITNDPSADSQGSGIAARVADFLPSGIVKFENELVVNQEQDRAQFYPNVITLDEGRLLFTWKGYKQSGGGYNQMYAAGRIATLTSANTLAFATEFIVADYFVQGSEPLDASAVSVNEIMVIWTQYSYPEKIGVQGKVIEFRQNNYIDETSVFPIEQTIQDNQNFHSITKLSDEFHLIVWESSGVGINGRLFKISSN